MAVNAAQRGADTLVPPTELEEPLPEITLTLSATIETSGTLRKVAEPPLVAILAMPCCQLGIAKVVLMPPPVPTYWLPTRPQFHAVSEMYEAFAPVVSVVPPTAITNG